MHFLLEITHMHQMFMNLENKCNVLQYIYQILKKLDYLFFQENRYK